MTKHVISVEEFERTRVARFNELEGSSQPMLDAVIPGQEREIYQVIGKGVSEDPDAKIPIVDNAGFNVAIVRCAPGKGTLHHDHKTNEVFTALTGKWKIFWGDDEDSHFVILEPFDTASVPPNLMRGFRNVGDEEGLLLGTVAGTDPGGVKWRDDVLAEASRLGHRLDKDGQIIEAPAAAE
ncbi:MAG: cupin domain-containing protein [Proteobacteria bacterium]|nr:cupin domain-containing protein [Pseudomonadota bacterium]MDA1354639.1 cupin domain-containing protein [Pseudomonadota bacterium]